jgi:hypothetical protein
MTKTVTIWGSGPASPNSVPEAIVQRGQRTQRPTAQVSVVAAGVPPRTHRGAVSAGQGPHSGSSLGGRAKRYREGAAGGGVRVRCE